MKNVLCVVLAVQLVILTGCGDEPSMPVLPDGLHRVPVNRVPPGPGGSQPGTP